MGLGVVVTAWAAMDRSQTSNTNNSKINRVGPYSWMGLGDSRKMRRVGPLGRHGPQPDFTHIKKATTRE